MALLKKHYLKQILNIDLNTKFKFLEAQINYTIIHFEDGNSHKTAYTLSAFEKLFQTSPNFQRIHKSYIVNMDFVKKIELDDSKFELKCGIILPISRRRKKNFEAYQLLKQA